MSFSFEHEVKDILRAPHELVYELQGLSDEDLQGKTIGVDRSVKANCLATSCGTFHALERVNLERIRRKELGAQRHQRRLARARKGAANRRKLIQKLARKKGLQGAGAAGLRAQDQSRPGRVGRQTYHVRGSEDPEHGATAQGQAGRKGPLAPEPRRCQGGPEAWPTSNGGEGGCCLGA